MGSITGTAIKDRIRKRLMDPSPGAFWTDAEILAELDAAMRAICQVKTDAFPKANTTFALAAGARQTLPSDGYQILDVISDSAGNPIGQVERDFLNSVLPVAPQMTTPVAAGFESFSADPREPKTFYIYPPATAGAQVSIVYGAVPPAFANLASAIPLDDIYEDAIYEYALSQLYGDSTKRGDVTKAAYHLNNFRQHMGLKAQAWAMNVPKPETTGGER